MLAKSGKRQLFVADLTGLFILRQRLLFAGLPKGVPHANSSLLLLVASALPFPSGFGFLDTQSKIQNLEERKMKNWQKDRTYRKQENVDGSYTYIITVDGEDVEVSKEIYKAHSSSERKMEYMEFDLKRNRVLHDTDGKTVLDDNGFPIVLPEREISLDKLVAEDWDFLTSEPSPEDAVIRQLEIKDLYNSLDSLNTDERQLIDALFFEGLTEREYSVKTGIAQKTINDRKHRILGRLKKLLQK